MYTFAVFFFRSKLSWKYDFLHWLYFISTISLPSYPIRFRAQAACVFGTCGVVWFGFPSPDRHQTARKYNKKQCKMKNQLFELLKADFTVHFGWYTARNRAKMWSLPLTLFDVFETVKKRMKNEEFWNP